MEFEIYSKRPSPEFVLVRQDDQLKILPKEDVFKTVSQFPSDNFCYTFLRNADGNNGCTFADFQLTSKDVLDFKIITEANCGDECFFVSTIHGKRICVPFSKVSEDSSVMDLKEHISEVEFIPVDQQRFIFSGKQLEDCKKLKDSHIKGGSVVHLVLRLRGGGSPEPEHIMSLAPGGFIKQSIYKDKEHPEIYRLKGKFKVEIFDTYVYEKVVGRSAPPTPISYKIYNLFGFPWYDIYDEKVPSIKVEDDNLVNQQEPIYY